MSEHTTTASDEREILERARLRYLNNAEFHAEVNWAVTAAVFYLPPPDERTSKIARGVATDAVILALYLRDNPLSPSTDRVSRLRRLSSRDRNQEEYQ